MNFTHLHVHSQYSVLDGMSKVTDLVDKCIRTGMNAIALTDHGNMYGIKELLDYCKTLSVPFKPIVGCEAYCARRGRHSMSNEEALSPEGKTYIIDRSGWHLILLAKNKKGYQNLCRMISLAFMDDAFKYTSRIDKELLEQYHEGIICCSACLGGELAQKVMKGLKDRSAEGPAAPEGPLSLKDRCAVGQFKEAEETIEWFKNLFGEDYYIEIQRHQTDKPGGDQSVFQHQKEVNPVLIELAHKHGVKVICTNDAHFVEEEHAEAHDRLICLSTNHYVDDIDRMHYTKQEWLKTPEEMAAIFADIPEALENTQEIVDKVEIYDIDSDPIMPKFPIPESFATEEEYRTKFTEQELFDEFTRNERGEVIMDEAAAHKKIDKLGGIDRLYRIKLEADYLQFLVHKGAIERYGEDRVNNDEVLKERIAFELHTMKTMGFPGYFLIVMDFIRAAREELDVSVGPGRGSAAGSVVAYCLHITDLDPLEYDLLFERFLNPDRISLPDIDTDFDDAGRGKVIDWVSEKYGHTHVAHIITYGQMAAKSAIQDVGRVQRVPLPRVNEIKAFIPDKFPDTLKDEKGKTPKINLKNCYKYVDDLKQLLNGDEPEIRSMLEYAQQLEGTVRQVGIHACGIIIGADDLTKFAPLSSVEDPKEKRRILVTEYDGHVIESVGLIKMDFLGLKTLTIIRECLKNIKHTHGIEIDIDHISKEDELTYKLFQEGRTVAVFQFESGGMQKYLKELKPTVIGDLIAMNALYRPGPMEYIPSFIRRKHGEEPITYDIPEMESILKDTYGVTVYQEQVMLLSRKLANFTRGESDMLRKAMGKKKMDVLQKMKSQFLEGGKANGHPEKILEKIWKDWEAFASYAFNKSHAACYAWVAYQTAYLKAHYPAEFMAANLTDAKDDITEVTKLMDECKAMRIPVLEPDVNESELNFTVNKEGAIRFGLGGIKGVGEGAVQAILDERNKNGKFKDIYDFVERINLQSCNRKTMESMALAGAFDSFDLYREQLMGVNTKGENVLETLMRYGTKFQEDKQQQTNSLFGDLGDGFGIDIAKPELPQVPRMNAIERLNMEKSLIGIFLSAHPLDDYEFEITKLCNTTTADLNQYESLFTPEGRKAAGMIGGEEEGQRGGEAEGQRGGEAIKVKLSTLRSQTDGIQGLRFGGIVTSAEEAVSQKGNPYGRYIIEDYAGSYKLTLFGETYKTCAPMLKPNLYVMITGNIVQRGFGRQWFKPKSFAEAEYEFSVQKIDLLQDTQKNLVSELTFSIPVEHVQPEFIAELTEQCQAHKGNIRLKMVIFDELHKNVITFTSQSYAVTVDKEFYHWIRLKEQEGVFSLAAN